jgi:hypothetical protein
MLLVVILRSASWGSTGILLCNSMSVEFGWDIRSRYSGIMGTERRKSYNHSHMLAAKLEAKEDLPTVVNNILSRNSAT